MMMNPSAFSDITQRILSQSNNVSYGARGAYRVSDTPDDRKGDYFFRDFFMVAVCGYMFEFANRFSQKLYNIPNTTAALDLGTLTAIKHPMTFEPLYKGVRNYTQLPQFLQERTMGTLVRSGSISMIPSAAREELLLKQMAPPDLDKTLKALIQTPRMEENFVEKFVTQNIVNKPNPYGLGTIGAEEGQRIIVAVNGLLNDTQLDLENETVRKMALKKLFPNAPELEKAAATVLQVEQTRQQGLLLDHLQKRLNFKEYLQDRHFQNNTASKEAINVIQAYADKMMHLEFNNREALMAAAQEVCALPISSRGKAFAKKLEAMEKHFYLNDKLLTSPETLKRFKELADEIQTIITNKDYFTYPSKQLEPTFKKVDKFFEDLREPEIRKAHLESLWNPITTELQSKTEGEFTNLLKSAGKLPPAERLKAFEDGLKKLRLKDYMPHLADSEAQFKALTDEIRAAFSQETAHVPKPTLDALSGKVKDFSKTLTHDESAVWKPLLRHSLPDVAALKNEVLKYVGEGLSSKATADMLKVIQKRGTWIPMGLNLVLNFIFYGLLATKFDNNILQPYQKKLVAERGSSQAMVNAGYLGAIPGLAVALGSQSNKIAPIWLQKMGYFGRFAVGGALAVGTYAASSLAIMKLLTLKSPKNPAPADNGLQNAPASMPSPLSLSNAAAAGASAYPSAALNNQFAGMSAGTSMGTLGNSPFAPATPNVSQNLSQNNGFPLNAFSPALLQTGQISPRSGQAQNVFQTTQPQAVPAGMTQR